MKKVVVSVVSVALAACSTAPTKIAAQSVSPLQYQSYDCDQIASEQRRLETRISELGGRLQKSSDNDAALMGVGLVLFWPALFFLGGTSQQEAEYGRIKGEYEALQQASITKKCGMAIKPVPEPTANQS